MSEIVDVTNLLEFDKFRVYLECGHSILYDNTVDAISEYIGKNTELICYECKEKNNEC